MQLISVRVGGSTLAGHTSARGTTSLLPISALAWLRPPFGLRESVQTGATRPSGALTRNNNKGVSNTRKKSIEPPVIKAEPPVAATSKQQEKAEDEDDDRTPRSGADIPDEDPHGDDQPLDAPHDDGEDDEDGEVFPVMQLDLPTATHTKAPPR